MNQEAEELTSKSVDGLVKQGSETRNVRPWVHHRAFVGA